MTTVATLGQDTVTDDSDDPGPDADRRERVAALHDHLAATAELPVDREASLWLGEAEAVAADLRGASADPETVRERVGHVVDLLTRVEGTDHPAADEHVAAARELARSLLDSE